MVKYPTWLCQNSELENGPVEIVDVPLKNGDFPVRYVSHYQRVVELCFGIGYS